MRARAGVAIALWALARWAPCGYSDAVSGDLLEEFAAGRSSGWVWRQVLSVVWVGFVRRGSRYVMPVGFSAAWSMLYPAWQLFAMTSHLVRALFERWAAASWPYSACFELGRGILPAVVFLWTGFFLYVALGAVRIERQAALRMLGGLSVSLNVLLIATIGMSVRAASSEANSTAIASRHVFLSPYHPGLSVALAVSLASAILTASPRGRGVRSGTQASA